jgi:FkbM family methyltransferase
MPGLHSKLRPKKVRSALARRRFEYALSRIAVSGFGGPVDVGTAYGGWMVPVDVVAPGWIAYCVGVGGDISFDLDLIKRFDMTVRAFEPVQAFVDGALQTAAGEPRFGAEAVAIAPADGPIRMQATHHPGSDSVSAAGLYDTQDWFEVPGATIPSLMAQHGDARVDLLKLDIEGGEYEVLPGLDLAALGVKVFSVQLHHNGGVRAARALVTSLASQGYEAVAVRPVVKVTFVHRGLLAADSEPRGDGE